MPTAEQQQAYRSLHGRIEARVTDAAALGALRAETAAADITDDQREDLVGLVEQYRADMANRPGVMPPAELDRIAAGEHPPD